MSRTIALLAVALLSTTALAGAVGAEEGAVGGLLGSVTSTVGGVVDTLDSTLDTVVGTVGSTTGAVGSTVDSTVASVDGAAGTVGGIVGSAGDTVGGAASGGSFDDLLDLIDAGGVDLGGLTDITGLSLVDVAGLDNFDAGLLAGALDAQLESRTELHAALSGNSVLVDALADAGIAVADVVAVEAGADAKLVVYTSQQG
jgi:hypothetical protein